MPYKKGSLAEQMGKLRKTAKRRIARLEKEAANTSSERERAYFNQQIRNLKDEVSRTYQINPLTHKATGFSHDQLKIAQQNLTRLNTSSSLGSGAQRRKNFLTQQEINNAMPANKAEEGDITAEQVHVFYRATQRAWEDLPSTADRNQAILDYFGETDLKEFFNKVVSQNRKAVSEAEGGPIDTPEDLTQEQDKDRNPSDDWVAYVAILNREKWEQIKYDENDSD